jgi:hypothetical protein
MVNAPKRLVAAADVLLVFPAALFMASLFVRNLQPRQYEPARSAERIVEWFATRPVPVGLWILLIGLPAVVVVTGAGALAHSWLREPELRRAAKRVIDDARAHSATLVTLAATTAAAGILAAVAIHVLTD